MKISKLLVISLSMVSSGALAFQANDRQPREQSDPQMRSVEERLFSQSNHQSVSGLQNIVSGTCAATPMTGCGCAFCTMLRSQRA